MVVREDVSCGQASQQIMLTRMLVEPNCLLHAPEVWLCVGRMEDLAAERPRRGSERDVGKTQNRFMHAIEIPCLLRAALVPALRSPKVADARRVLGLHSHCKASAWRVSRRLPFCRYRRLDLAFGLSCARDNHRAMNYGDATISVSG